MTTLNRTEAELTESPVLFVELAHAWAAGGPAPTIEHELWLKEIERPYILNPADAREALWGVLSYPERGRALTWLDRAGLLEEILPCWAGDYFRQALRLQAVEEVHLEKWAIGLADPAFDWLCVYMDQRVDGRLGGWGLSGLATLLLTGDEPATAFASRVERDLKILGTTDGERRRVVTAIEEFPDLYDALSSGNIGGRRFQPTTIVATLSTVQVIPYMRDESRAQMMQFADKILSRFVV